MMTSGRPSRGAGDEYAPPVTIATAACSGRLKRGGGHDRPTAGGPPDGANAAPGRQEARRYGERAATEALVDRWMALATGGLIDNIDDPSQLSPDFLDGVWEDLARAQYVAATGEDPNWAEHASAAREAPAGYIFTARAVAGPRDPTPLPDFAAFPAQWVPGTAATVDDAAALQAARLEKRR